MATPTFRLRPSGSALAAVLALVSFAGVTPARAQQRVIALGESKVDSLTGKDPVGRSRNSAYHLWTFDGRRGQRIQLDMMSSDFDSYLVLRDPDGMTVATDDDGGGGNNARIRTVLLRDGRYRVVAEAFNADGKGRYTLQLGGWEAPPGAAPGAVATLRVGQEGNGLLEPGDSTGADGPFEDHWTFDATAGQRLRIELRSEDFDAYLEVFGPDGALIGKDDDGLGGKNSLVTFRAPVAGHYTAIASSFGDNPATGAYRIALIDDSGNFPDPGMVATITPGQTKEGRLETGDDSGPRGWQDRWTFTGRAGQVVRIDVASSQFDTYLTLLRDGVPVDSNDDGGDGTNSRLVVSLPANGAYTAIVSSYRENTGGRYQITLALAPAPAGPGQVARVQPGQTLSGRLEPGDKQRGNGAYEDWFDLDGRAGQQVAIELHSSAFDAYLELRDPSGNIVAENDDGGQGTDSYIVTSLPVNGHYRIVARSYGDDPHTGLYELKVSTAPPAAAPGRVVELRAGTDVVGRLEPGDSILGDSTYADLYTFRADRSGDATIELRSGDFDAYLMLQDETGRTLASDDDGAGGTDARITTRLNQGQIYRIVANSYGDERATGTYRLSLRWSP